MAAKSIFFNLLLASILCIIAFASQSAPPIDLTNNKAVFLADIGLWHPLDDAQSTPTSLAQLEQKYLNTQAVTATLVNQSGAYLARVPLHYHGAQASNRFIWINANFVDVGLAFWQSSQDRSLRAIDFSQHSDALTPKLMHAQAFELTLNEHESGVLWLYIKAEHFALPLSVNIVNSADFFQHAFISNTLTVFAIAMMLTLATLALALYFKTRAVITLACAGYIGLHGLGWAAASGLIDDVFNVQSVNSTYLGMMLFPVAIAAACQYTRLLFNLNYQRPSWAKVFNIIAVISLGFGLGSPFFSFSTAFAIAHAIAFIWMPLALFVGYKMLKNNDFRAKYYLTGNLLYSASLVYYMLSHSHVLTGQLYSELVVLLALAADCFFILLSLAAWLKNKKQDYSRAYVQARVDPLTSAGNRHALNEALERLPDHYVMSFIDYDGVKTINDVWGHDVGDELLQQGTLLMTDALRGKGEVFRTGGDEFVWLLRLSSASDIKAAIHDIKKMIATCQHTLQQQWPDCGISYGIAHSLESANESECLALADQRMYQHKRAKHNPR